jgi:hypothetical protein
MRLCESQPHKTSLALFNASAAYAMSQTHVRNAPTPAHEWMRTATLLFPNASTRVRYRWCVLIACACDRLVRATTDQEYRMWAWVTSRLHQGTYDDTQI